MSTLERYFLPPAKTALAHQTDALFWFLHISGLILMIGIVVAIIYFCYTYRRTPENEVTPVIKGNNKLEVAWSVIPLAFVLIVFGWGLRIFLDQETAPDDAYKVEVTAQQWLWRFKYSNGASSTKELHVPAGRPVQLVMKSNDVIHSLYIPAFRIKQDVLPNRYTSEWFNAPKPGKSIIFCTEYCGDGHSNMHGEVIVQTPAKFKAWLSKQASSGGSKPSGLSEADWGKKLVSQNACATCHSIDGSSGTGPTWKGLFGSTQQLADGSTVKADADYIHESIVKPTAKIVKGYQSLMPANYGDQLNDKQLSAIIAYIKTLK